MNFRIKSITVEGFKGFTNKQGIPIDGKNLFIFGPNGYGKSSIIEAIRWCLFGLTGRPEEIVRNQFYTTNCFMELELVDQDNKIWKVQRTLPPGASRSRMKILDPKENERTQSDVFPFLTSLGPREGTYIVFGGPSQFPSRKRPLESIEISDFGRTIYTYLRLEELPELIDKLNSLIEVQKEEVKQLEEGIDAEKHNIEIALETTNGQLTAILKDPPWGDFEPPTREQTKEKIRNLITQLGQEIYQTPSENLNENDLISLAERWIQNSAVPEKEKINKRIAEIREKHRKIKYLRHELKEKGKEINDIKHKKEELEEKRKELLGDKNLNKIQEELEEFNEQIERTSLLMEIIRKSQSYLENNDVEECFICSRDISREELTKNIEQRLEQNEPNKLRIIQKRDELQDLVSRVKQIEERLERTNIEQQQNQSEYEEKKNLLCEVLESKSEEFTAEEIEHFLKDLEGEIERLEDSLESKEKYQWNWERKIEQAKRELRFHQYRKQRERLETRLEVGLEPVEERYDELVEFRESLEDIRNVLYSELKKVLENALPLISSLMTGVYRHLTNQLSFDEIKLELKEKKGSFSPKLLVRVCSSEEPDSPPLDPEQVLNGQALNALRLVPYFVFSRFQRDSWGLDLLLLDDPTQSFDTERIELLLKELSVASSHAQIIVCTHEEDRFLPFLSNFFREEDKTIVKVKGFDRRGGPQIEIVR